MMNYYSKSRIEYIDVARGIAIISIIAGHMGSLTVNRIVFTFHVPIFFLFTGYFLSEKQDIFGFIKRQSRKLLVPYFLTCVVIIAIGTVKGLTDGTAKVEFFNWLYAACYGAGDTYQEPFYIKQIGAIWFLWATFWGSVFLRLSLMCQRWTRIIFVTTLFLVSIISAKTLFWFPLSIQAGGCLPFYVYRLSLQKGAATNSGITK